ncbi:MAG: tetratricopeptide repeat protein [Planctomycetes bacterium]|nr:tetratricopeptide repeat protein [Planctomycetota bacterium]
MTPRHFSCVFVAACAALIFSTASATASASADGGIDETAALAAGNGLLNRGLYDLAATEYERFIAWHADHPKIAEARYGFGVCLYHLRRYDEAIVNLEQLPADHAYAAEATTVLGQCKLNLGRYTQAADALEIVVVSHRAHELFDDAAALQAEALYLAGAHDRVGRPAQLLADGAPNSPRRERVELIWCLSDIARGDYRAASGRLREMQQRFPDGAHADQTALLLAQSLHHLRDLPAALDVYRSVARVARDEYVPDALYGLATVLYDQKQIAPAGDVLDELLERFPDDERARPAALLRGRVWLDQKKYDPAVKIFDRALAAGGPYLDEATYWRAKCDLRRDDPAEAARRLTGAVERFPKSRLMPEMLYDLAVALTRSEAPAEAVATLERLLTQYVRHALAVDALHLLALAEHDRERWEESSTHCRAFLQKHGGHQLASSAAFLHAENAYRAGTYEDAIDRYRTYLDTYPGAARREAATFRLGMTLYRLDRHDASTALLEAVTGGNGTPDEFHPALLALGDLYFQDGRWAEARRLFSRYLDGNADAPGADDALLKLGLTHHREGHPDAAIPYYETLIETMPSSPHHVQARFERGQALVELDRADESVADFEAVVEASPDSALALHALNHLGAIDVTRQRYAEAARRYGRAAAFATSDEAIAAALLHQGRALMSARQFTEAGEALSKLLVRPARITAALEARARLGICLARQDRHAPALAAIAEVDVTDVAGLDPQLAASLAYEQAWCLRALDRRDEARGAYRRILALPVTGEVTHHARLELAELEADAGRYADAAALLRPMVDAAGADAPPADLAAEAMYRLAVCAYQVEDFDEAARLLERYLQDHADGALGASAFLLCGESLFRIGAHQRAIAWLERAISDCVDDESCGSALLRLGECQATLQQWAKSEAAFTEHRRRYPDSGLWFQSQFGLGWAQENQARYDDAIAAYGPVIARHQGPTAARAQFQIGECLFATKKHADAVREFLKVDILYDYPEWSAAALYEAASCFQVLGRNSDARAHLQRVVQEHEGSRWAELATTRLAQPTAPLLPGH